MVSASVSAAGRMVRTVSVMVAMVRPRRKADEGRRVGRRAPAVPRRTGPGARRTAVAPASLRAPAPAAISSQLATQPSPPRASVRANRPSVSGSSRTMCRSARSAAGPTQQRDPRITEPGAAPKVPPGASRCASSPAARSSSTVAQPRASAPGTAAGRSGVTRRASCRAPAPWRPRTRAARTGRWPSGCPRRRPGGPTRCRRRSHRRGPWP